MSALRNPADPQRVASDPQRSVFVAANAGSGKTHVLAQRVVRLLLAGAEPSRILCLTYTKAAAAEMQTRVFQRLSSWTRLPDDALRAEIEALEPAAGVSGKRLAEARRLFARALETPGGLKIQTIHAFCEAVLHQFPLEANIPGHFEVMDDGQAALLLADARRMLVTGAHQGDPDDPVEAELSLAFADALGIAGEWGLDTLVGEIVAKRDRLRRFVEDAGGPVEAEDRLRRALGLEPGASENSVLADIDDLPGLDVDARHTLLAAARRSDKATDAKLAEKLAAFEAATGRAHRFAILESLLLTTAGQPRKPGSVATKAVAAVLPDFTERLAQAEEARAAMADRWATLRLYKASRAALVIAEHLEADYAAMKRRRGFLDFEDLIVRTADLLMRGEAAAWVHFKLDQGLDHVLVDEAQDTSPRQWQVVRQLVEEFFAGASARETPRTVFAVGDEKQSIYSFQGASPAMFAAERRNLERLAEEAGLPFSRVELHRSFRSVPAVLQTVDKVFAAEGDRRGLSSGDEPPVHESARIGDPGLIEIWPPIVPAATVAGEDWLDPLDHQPEGSPAIRLARRIAQTIGGWIGQPIRVKGKLRPIGPGDVIVLVRKRSSFVAAVGAALREAKLPVAGADRLVITDHIAVNDLVALGRAVSNIEDELSLAAALKSPLLGFSDDDLMALALSRDPARPEALYRTLRRLAGAKGREHLPDFAPDKAGLARRAKAAFERLEELRQRSGFETVFTFFARILGPEGGRARLAGRLGHEAGEVVDAFLELAHGEEEAGRGGLDEFLAALEASPPEIKREMDHGRGEIRVMTTHASKGLEAPIVFLVDPGSAPFSHSHGAKLMEWEGMPGLVPGQQAGFLWCADKTMRNAAVTALQARERMAAEDEYRRLLYVGLTRAADRLVVCGLSGMSGPDEASWIMRVQSALGGGDDVREIRDGEGALTALRIGEETTGRMEAEAIVAPAPPRPIDLSPLPPEPLPPRPLSPSSAGGANRLEIDPDDEPRGSPVLGMRGSGLALERGRLMHRLLQVLPDVESRERAATAERFLGAAGHRFAPEARAALARQAIALIEDPDHAAFFGPGSRAEVGIAGDLDLGGFHYAVTGAVDRMAVESERILVLDYKTGRSVPDSAEAVPDGMRLQLALYRELLRPLYPGRRIEAYLLFTDAPRLLAVGPELLDAALEARGARAAASRAGGASGAGKRRA